MKPREVMAFIETRANTYRHRQASVRQRGFAAAMLESCFDDYKTKKRRFALQYLFGVESINDLSDGDVLALLDWLKPFKDYDGSWVPADSARSEAQEILDAYLQEQWSNNHEEDGDDE